MLELVTAYILTPPDNLVWEQVWMPQENWGEVESHGTEEQWFPWARTCCALLAGAALYQLTYIPAKNLKV